MPSSSRRSTRPEPVRASSRFYFFFKFNLNVLKGSSVEKELWWVMKKNSFD